MQTSKTKGLNKKKYKVLIKDAFKEGLEYVKHNYDISKPDPWEDHKYHKDIVTKSTIRNDKVLSFNFWNRKVPNYRFGVRKNDEYVAFSTWNKFRDFALNDELYRKYYSLERFEKAGNIHKKFREELCIEYVLSEFIDHYIHKFNSKKFNEKRFNSLFEYWFKGINSKELHYELWIPIIYTKFEAKSFKIDKNIRIEEIPDSLHISRHLYINNGIKTQGTKTLLINSCSHAIVLNNWKFKGELNHDSLFPTFAKVFDVENFHQQIDSIIGAIRILSGINIGYYQIFAKPIGWKRKWVGKYSSVITAYREAYPPSYEDFLWLKAPQEITKKQLHGIKSTYKGLLKSNDRKLHFAINKLNSIITRSKNQDIVFDTTVALESLLANDSQSEITYRLSTRGSYISSIMKFEDKTNYEVKFLLSKLYGYRSAIAHGNPKAKLKKFEKIKYAEGKEIELLPFAISFLRFSIKFFIQYPELIDNKELDKYFMNKYVK